MRHINNDGVIVGEGVDSYRKLGEGEDTGCVENGSNLTYPPDSPHVTPKIPNTVNPLEVDVDHYYLQNVLPREMNVATHDLPLAALKAQALAARSIAEWKATVQGFDEFKSIDNSTNFQVFEPGSYDVYLDQDPDKASAIKDRIDQAILETSSTHLKHTRYENGYLIPISVILTRINAYASRPKTRAECVKPARSDP
jgi:peptidoglycan hydrolase-like amidase